MEKGLNTEGLFRVPGSAPVVNKYKALFDTGEGFKIDFLDEELGEEMTSDNIASLLKCTHCLLSYAHILFLTFHGALVYLRELPEPLFTKEKDNQFCELMDENDDAIRTQKYRDMIATLPQVNQAYLSRSPRLLFILLLLMLSLQCRKGASLLSDASEREQQHEHDARRQSLHCVW